MYGDGPVDGFGDSLSLSSDGGYLAVGARQTSLVEKSDSVGPPGFVRVLCLQGNSWNRIGEDIVGEAAEDSFGDSVSLSTDGRVVAVGARLNDGTATSSGHARVAYFNRNSWIQVGEDSDGDASLDFLDYDAAISPDGRTLVVSAIGGAGSNGLVLVFSSS